MEQPPAEQYEPVAAVAAVTALPSTSSSTTSLSCIRMPPEGSGNKRSLLASTAPQSNSKKRRKQSRPIRIASPSTSEGTSEGTSSGPTTKPPPLPPPPLPPVLQPPSDEQEEGELRYLQDAPSTHPLPSVPGPLGTSYPESFAKMHSLLPNILSFPPHFLLPMLPSSSTSSVTPGNSGTAVAPPPRIFNLEAYCELCSKEFCNKYFLKTHKANRHGIYVHSGDTSPSSTTPLPPATTSSEVSQSSPSPVKVSETPRYSCDVCHKKFNNEYSVKRHKSKVHLGTGSGGEETVMPAEETSSPVMPVEQPPSETSTSVELTRNGSDDDTSPPSPGRLRRLGVINADAFCDLCSKEYCNKYFLKTHKLKRHGIVMRDSPEENKPELGKVRPWEPSVQTSPLNLAIHEHAVAAAVAAAARLEEVTKTEPEPEPELEINPVSPARLLEDSRASADMSEDLQKLQTMLLQLSALNECEAGAESELIENGASANVEPIPAPEMPQDTGPETLPEEDTRGSSPMGGSNSCYCDICNKELCNKYFKKVHMQKMHGIEIKENALSGGVPCDICHKQLCSKYFVRVHKQNTHGIVEQSPSPVTPVPEPLPPVDSALKPSEPAELSHRYYTHFNVVCPLCSRRFRSAKWLRAHLINDHAEAGHELARELEPKPNSINTSLKGSSSPQEQEAETEGAVSMLSRLEPTSASGGSVGGYHCSYCNFSTPVLSLLLVHERTHTGLPAPLSAYSCNMCFKSYASAELLQRHVRSHQLREEQEPDSPTPSDEGVVAGRYRCSHCQQRFRTRELWSAHVATHEQPPFSCPLCPFTSDVLSNLKKHVKQDHWTESGGGVVGGGGGGGGGAAAAALWRALQLAAREAHVPATYAVPQPPQRNQRFTMQPFLLEEPQQPQRQLQQQQQNTQQPQPQPPTDAGTFVPSLVFLPVREKVSGTLTVSFTLTPA